MNLQKQINEIRIIENTLGVMRFEGTHENANHLLGMHRLLRQIRDELQEAEKVSEAEPEAAETPEEEAEEVADDVPGE